MIPNPFIHLFEQPIATLTFAGYAIAMLAVAILGLSYVAREGLTLAALATRDHRQGAGQYGEWWGDWNGGWIPPAPWTARAAKVAFVAVVMLWALATVVYLAV